jgi:hypothetical protein
MGHHGHVEFPGEPVRAALQVPGVGVQGPDNRRRAARQRGFQGGKGEFVSPDRTGERVAGQPRDDFLAAQQQASLWAAE